MDDLKEESTGDFFKWKLFGIIMLIWQKCDWVVVTRVILNQPVTAKASLKVVVCEQCWAWIEATNRKGREEGSRNDVENIEEGKKKGKCEKQKENRKRVM